MLVHSARISQTCTWFVHSSSTRSSKWLISVQTWLAELQLKQPNLGSGSFHAAQPTWLGCRIFSCSPTHLVIMYDRHSQQQSNVVWSWFEARVSLFIACKASIIALHLFSCCLCYCINIMVCTLVCTCINWAKHMTKTSGILKQKY